MRTVELKPSAPTIRSESKEFKEFGVEEEEVEEEEVLSTGVLYERHGFDLVWGFLLFRDK